MPASFVSTAQSKISVSRFLKCVEMHCSCSEQPMFRFEASTYMSTHSRPQRCIPMLKKPKYAVPALRSRLVSKFHLPSSPQTALLAIRAKRVKAPNLGRELFCGLRERTLVKWLIMQSTSKRQARQRARTSNEPSSKLTGKEHIAKSEGQRRKANITHYATLPP